MKNKNKSAVIGFLGPIILTCVLILLFDYADIKLFEYLTESILNNFTVGTNIANYAIYPKLFSAAFLTNISLIPLLILHWWPLVDAKNPKGYFRVVSLPKGSLFLLLAALLPIGLWCIPLEPEDIQNTGRYALINIYKSSFLFYLFFLMPICFWTSLLAGYIKTIVFFKNN